jgi:hypothetical protein
MIYSLAKGKVINISAIYEEQMMTQKKFRTPTSQEFDLLKKYYKTKGLEEKTITKIIQDFWFAVFDAGISSDPTDESRVIIAIYGMIEFYEVFLLQDQSIDRIPFYCLSLEETMKVTKMIHTAVTIYMQTLGYGRRRRRTPSSTDTSSETTNYTE